MNNNGTSLASRERERETVLKHPGTSLLRSSDPMKDQLLWYRYYRLRTGSKGVNNAGMVKLRNFIKILDITMKGHHFDGSDVISVFQFLIHFFTEVDKSNMSEGQDYLDFPSYLTRRAKCQLTFM